MDLPSAILLASIVAYFVGSIPFGFMIGKFFFGTDIRDHGSGNIGATNVWRLFGWKWGLGCLGLDFLKGFLPVWLLPVALLPADPQRQQHLAVACGVSAIIAHMYPCWLRFRGGKGVATALGVVSYLSPWGTLVAAATFALSLGLWRMISLSSICAVIAFAVSQIVRTGGDLFTADQWSLSIFSLAIPVLIIYRHRANLRRLWRGEEPKFQFRKRAAKPDAGSN